MQPKIACAAPFCYVANPTRQDCKRTKESDAISQCVNCNSKGHPASYKDCSKAPHLFKNTVAVDVARGIEPPKRDSENHPRGLERNGPKKLLGSFPSQPPCKVSNNDIDTFIGALTKHIRIVVKRYQRKIPANLDRRRLPADVRELIKTKNATLRRASAYPTPEYRYRTRAQHKVKARLQTDQPPERSRQAIRESSQNTTHDHLLGNGLIIRKQFEFRPNYSCPQQALRLVEHISEGFKRKRKTVAVFFDVVKAFDKTNDIPRLQIGVQLAFFANDTALYLHGSNFRQIISRLQKNPDELTRWFRTQKNQQTSTLTIVK
ncbi:hypothetical protein EVAR_61165_1 [Eumeta japonica]|uniref:Uncharacterized protein n=1 Tax=Eumeta variegata TaxID=151549 RepID=A0A4C1ZTG7_EUMVA|nr:hypothetical protein EVAR_61165_1 [Eumeta japonica]